MQKTKQGHFYVQRYLVKAPSLAKQDPIIILCIWLHTVLHASSSRIKANMSVLLTKLNLPSNYFLYRWPILKGFCVKHSFNFSTAFQEEQLVIRSIL